MGRITRDPELRKTQGGMDIASFSVATNRVWKNKAGEKQEDVEFHNVVAFGRTAENIVKYFGQGDEIFIEGYLKTSSWDDKSSGKKAYRTEIMAERFDFGQKKRGSAGGRGGSGVGADGHGESYNQDQSAPAVSADEIDIEDIPF